MNTISYRSAGTVDYHGHREPATRWICSCGARGRAAVYPYLAVTFGRNHLVTHLSWWQR